MPAYFLPEDARQQPQPVSEYLHLLAELSQPEHASPDHLILPVPAFTQLAEAADHSVATAAFQPVPRKPV
ncbi:MAG: hypothetical protein ACREO0_08350 [Pseudoxanthomonas sp.]